MITVISGTNARNSNTLKVAETCLEHLHAIGAKAQLLNLTELPADIISPDMYHNRSASFLRFQEKYLIPAEKFAIIIPEYNGGVPGIFKLMVDCCDIKKVWYGKKVSLTGTAAGRSGNLRGLDHMTNMLNYLQVDVMKNKIPISRIQDLLDEQGDLSHRPTIDLLKMQMEQLVEF